MIRGCPFNLANFQFAVTLLLFGYFPICKKNLSNQNMKILLYTLKIQIPKNAQIQLFHLSHIPKWCFLNKPRFGLFRQRIKSALPSLTRKLFLLWKPSREWLLRTLPRESTIYSAKGCWFVPEPKYAFKRKVAILYIC